MKKLLALILAIICVFGTISCSGPAEHQHVWGEWQQVTAPTATADGLKRRVCLNDSTHVEEKTLRSLDGKKIIFIGNSYTYYGNTVNVRTTTGYPSLDGRTNDKENFYKLCQSKGATVSVTNWTMDGHNLKDSLGDRCNASGKDCVGANHLEKLTDKHYDYVVFQAGSGDATDATGLVTAVNKFMQIFKDVNPNVRFVFLAQSQAHIKQYTWLPALKTLEQQGVIIVDWGNVVYDIMNGTTQVPNAIMTYDKNSFIVAKSASDGYHPNLLSGYITTLMTYCAITGEEALGSEYLFIHDWKSDKYQRNIDLFYQTFYKVADSNFRDILYSPTDMAGIQELIDNYLNEKPYINFN